MNASAAIEVEVPIERYAALIRAANTIANCSDCDTAAHALLKELRKITAFDYLQLVVFENGTGEVGWRLLYANGETKKVSVARDVDKGTTIEWVVDNQNPLLTDDWGEETRFSKHREFLRELGITSTWSPGRGL